MSTSTTSVVSHFPSAQNGFTTTLASTIASAAVTVPLNSVAGYTNGQTAVFVVDPTDTSKKQTFTGVIDTSGVQVTSVIWTAGTNQIHSAGSTVVDYATATHISMMSKGLLVEHLQTGKHTVLTDDGVRLATVRSDIIFDHVSSGCVITGTGYGTTLAWSMTSGVVYIGGRRLTVSSATGTVTASKDTYFDLLDPGSGTVATLVNTSGNIVANNAASPALAASSVRIGIVISGAGSIAAATSINQGQETMVLPIVSSVPYAVTDSLGNLICPRDPNRKLLGYRQILTSFTTASTSLTQITGLEVPVIIPTGRKVKVILTCSDVTNNNVAGYGNVGICAGTLGDAQRINGGTWAATAASTPHPTSLDAIYTSSSASMTFRAGLKALTAGTAAFNGDALGQAERGPAVLKVELE